MRLHDYPASANCFKVRLLLAQLGLDYERVNVDIFDGDTLTEEFARLNPARMTPVLETDEGDALPESVLARDNDVSAAATPMRRPSATIGCSATSCGPRAPGTRKSAAGPDRRLR